MPDPPQPGGSFNGLMYVQAGCTFQMLHNSCYQAWKHLQYCMVRLLQVHAQVAADEHFAEEVVGATLRD